MTVSDIAKLLRQVGLERFFQHLLEQLEKDFLRWSDFDKRPRIATHLPQGVIELMPTSDDSHYAFKFVNGHPNNIAHNKLTVAAFGAIASTETGYPSLISEMTVLTAIRTAAASALASKYLAQDNANRFGIIGTGAQSEFQVLAHYFSLGTREIFYFDTDSKAMKKFANNLSTYDLVLKPCDSAKSVVTQSQIVTSSTANKRRNTIIESDWVQPGTHINAIGGDCPGKTELDGDLLHHNKIVVEYTEQTKIEGEIQAISTNSGIYAELWELICKNKPARESTQEITIFDSVGFAIEDYSILKVVDSLAEQHQVGHLLDMLPKLSDPKDLYSLITAST